MCIGVCGTIHLLSDPVRSEERMQATITMQQEALPVVRAGVEMKRNVLCLSLRQYRTRLDMFEAQYGMASELFAVRFDAGELGDEADWFEWEYVLDAYREIARQLELLKGLKL